MIYKPQRGLISITPGTTRGNMIRMTTTPEGLNKFLVPKHLFFRVILKSLINIMFIT